MTGQPRLLATSPRPPLPPLGKQLGSSEINLEARLSPPSWPPGHGGAGGSLAQQVWGFGGGPEARTLSTSFGDDQISDWLEDLRQVPFPWGPLSSPVKDSPGPPGTD